MGGVTDSVFGKKEQSQQSQHGSQFTNFRPQDEANIRAQQGNVIGAANQFSDQANHAANIGMRTVNGVSTQFGQFNPNINSNFQGFQGSQGLDAQSQQLMSQELGNRAAQQNAQQSQIQQQFRNNPALAAILGQQSQAMGQLNNNPLAFQAGQQQQQRELQNYQANQGAQQLGNQAELARSQQFANLQGMGNQANMQQLQGLGQILGFQQQGAQAQNALLQSLSQIGQQFGQNVNSSQQSSFSSSPGLMERSLGYDPLNVVQKVSGAGPIGQAGQQVAKR